MRRTRGALGRSRRTASFAAAIALSQGAIGLAADDPQAIQARSIPNTPYVVAIVPGWEPAHLEGTEGTLALQGPHGTIAFDFSRSTSQPWTVESLMAQRETALASEYPGAQLVRRVDLASSGNRGQLALYRIDEGEGRGLLPLAGCMVLKDGGVGVLGLLVDEQAVKPVEWMLQTVTAPLAKPVAVSAVRLPGQEWAVHLDLAGFTPESDETRPDGLARKVVFKGDDNRVNVTVVLKPLDHPGQDPLSIRDDRLAVIRSSPPDKVGLRAYEEQGTASFEYFIEQTPYSPQPIHQKHVHRFLTSESHRAEVHASVTSFREEDGPWLNRFLGSVRIGKP